IPGLHLGVEQAFLGRQQAAAPVHVDAPPLEDHGTAADLRLDQGERESLRGPLQDFVVLLPVGVFGPGVEVKPSDGELCWRAILADEDRPEVPGPAAIRWKAQELDTLAIHADLVEDAAGAQLTGEGVADYPPAPAGRELADDLAVGPRDRGKLPRPIARVVGPAEPGRRVRLPLGGQTKNSSTPLFGLR